MPVATAAVPRNSARQSRPCSSHLTQDLAGEFIRRSKCLLEGYFSRPSREQAIRLARLMQWYFLEQYDLEWIRHEIERRSTKRVCICTSGKDASQGAAILFLERGNREVASLQINFSLQGNIRSKQFILRDDHPPRG